jgi:hypothetical protein
MDFTITMNGNTSYASLVYPMNTHYIGGVAEVYDRNMGHGSIDAVNPNGSVGPTTPIPAMLGDNVVLTIVNGDQTVSTCVVLQPGPQDPTKYCQ